MYVSSMSTTGFRNVRVTGTNACGSSNQDFVFYLSSFLLKVYPNPAKNQLTMEFSSLEDKGFLPKVIELVNERSMKKEIFLKIDDILKDSSKLQGNKYILDISKLERGIWYLRALKKDSEPEVIRLVFE